MCDFKKDIAVRYGVNAAVIAQLSVGQHRRSGSQRQAGIPGRKEMVQVLDTADDRHIPFFEQAHGSRCAGTSDKSSCDKERMPEQQQIRPHKLVCLHRIW